MLYLFERDENMEFINTTIDEMKIMNVFQIIQLRLKENLLMVIKMESIKVYENNKEHIEKKNTKSLIVTLKIYYNFTYFSYMFFPIY